MARPKGSKDTYPRKRKGKNPVPRIGRPTKHEDYRRIAVDVSPLMHRKLMQLSRKQRRNLSQTVRAALAQFIRAALLAEIEANKETTNADNPQLNTDEFEATRAQTAIQEAQT